MSNWKKVEEFIVFSTKGITPSYVDNSTVLVLNQRCVRDNRIDFSLARFTEDSKTISSNKTVQVGDILFNSTGQGTAGRCVFVKEIPNNIRLITDSHMLLLRCKTFYEARCLNYILYSYEKNIQLFLDGSTGQGELDKVKLFNLLVKMPFDTKAQKQIADVLSALDAKIELNSRINKELEAMAKTLYDYWFVQFDFPDENGKPYKSSGGKMVYNEKHKREIPDGWEVGELGDVINIYDSKRIPLSSQERVQRKGRIPYFGATSIMGYIDDYIFDDDYILIAEDGSVMDDKGYPIVQFIWGKTWVNNHAHVLEAKIKQDNEYIFHLVKTISVVQIMTGSIQMKINQENLRKVKLALPSENLLKLFSEFAIPIRKTLINNIEQNRQLIELRDWLLPMLMNGQVTVK
jgi:type I restriction enzyme, S subunit